MKKLQKGRLVLQEVRLSYPSLFKKAVFDGNETKFEATFILDKDKHKTEIEALKEMVNNVVKDAKLRKVPAHKIALKDGDEEGKEEYKNAYTLKCSSNKRPQVFDRDKTPLVEEDGRPYAGCYVNAIVDLWGQNNSYGKRINGNFYAVQFAKDGEAFGVGAEDFSDQFDEIEDIESDGDFPF